MGSFRGPSHIDSPWARSMLVCPRFPVMWRDQGSPLNERKVAYQIKHFSLHDQIMKRVHDLINRSGPIPPMHVQDVDVRRTQLLEGCLDGDVEGLCVISGVVHQVSNVILSPLEVACVLRVNVCKLICGRATRGKLDLPWLQ